MLTFKELQLRAALFQTIRTFFTSRGFLEVDTPIRLPHLIPERHIEPIKADNGYLQTSPELCMKRLLAGSCERIFQICKCFRKEEIGRRHLEEFTMLEWYRKDADYLELMTDCEELLHNVATDLTFCATIDKQDDRGVVAENALSILKRDAQRVSVAEAFSKWSPIRLEKAMNDGDFDELLVKYIEPNLGLFRPCILYDYPVELASLARKKRDDSSIAERFELYVEGIELANGFSELTDSGEQRERFTKELDSIRAHSREAQQMPEKFLSDLGKIKSAAGIALGLDRLFLLLLGKDNIQDAVTFADVDL